MRTASDAITAPSGYRAATVTEPPRYRAATVRERSAICDSVTSVPSATRGLAIATIESINEPEQILYK